MRVKESYGVSLGNKGAAALVAQSSASGPGVPTLKKSNFDSTGLRVVKRGCVVEFPGGATARVTRVRLGRFHVDVPASGLSAFVARIGAGNWFVHSCGSVRVVS